MNDRTIIAGLIQADNNAYAELYKAHYPSVENYVLQNTGTADDAKDIFQDTLIILHDKAICGNLEVTSSLKTFIYSISRNLWLKKLKERRSIVYPEPDETEKSAEEKIIDTEIKESFFMKAGRAFHKMTGHCKMLLYAMFFRKKSLSAIVEENGYKNIHTAQNQKYKCLEQARKELKK